MNKLEAFPIAGTEGGTAPFISPDGQWVGFWADKKLKKVQLPGGTAAIICDLASNHWGASWGSNDTIVFSNGTKLLQVPAAGGAAKALTTPDPAKGELRHLLPHVLPGGEAVLFSTQTSPSRWDNPRIELLFLKTGERRKLLDQGADARYAASGHLVFIRQGTLCAVPFDISRLKLTGEPVQLVPNIMQAANDTAAANNTFAAQFSFSSSGSLAYVTGGPQPDPERWLLWIDSTGIAQPVLTSPGSYHCPRLSPNRKHAVFWTLTKKNDIYVVDLERKVSTQLTFEGNNVFPLWTPDGKRIAFTRKERSDRTSIMWMSANGSGDAQPLMHSDKTIYAGSWSPRGDLLAFVKLDRDWDIWILHMADRKEEPVRNTRFSEMHPVFSPDGRYLAYASNESEDRYEIFVQSYPGSSEKIKISSGGGLAPCWGADGHQLFYLSGNRIMVVDVEAKPNFAAGIPRIFWDYYGPFPSVFPIRSYDVHPDGKRMLTTGHIFGGKPLRASDIPESIRQGVDALDPQRLGLRNYWLKMDPQRRISPDWERQPEEAAITKVNIVQNWFEELKRFVPTGK